MTDSILGIIQEQLIPWVNSTGIEQIAVAQAKLKEMKCSPHFSYTPQKMLGPRIRVRPSEFMITSAKWPNDHLLETPSPLLLFVVDGKADLHIGDYWLHAAQGQGVFTLSDVPRKDGTQPSLHPKNRKTGYSSTINFSEVRGRLIIWTNRCEGEIFSGFKLPPPIYTIDDHALQLLNQMQHHFSVAEPDSDVICLYLLKAFLLTLASDLKAERFVQLGTWRNMPRFSLDNYDPIPKAQEYICTHLTESLTIQKVARQVRMARTQFASRFKEETKLTFNQFVTKCRMEQAKILLRETDYTLLAVCTGVGYNSLAHFNRVFFKYFGISPQHFRETEHLNKNNSTIMH